MKNIFISFISIFVLLFISCKKTSETAAPQPPGPTQYQAKTIQYKSLPSINPNLLSLDLWSYSNTSSLKPVVIYIHGGGWRIGDKTNKLDKKIALFNSLNYIFISANYRLSPSPSAISNSNRIKYPDHNNDVADVVKWVVDSISKYGGNPAKIAMLGHSAGAHLVSLTGTSQLFLPARNISLSSIKGIASVDTEGYDVTSQSSEDIYQNAFGTDNNTQVQASPIFNLTNLYSYPKFFIAKRGIQNRIALADAFINKLQLVGAVVSQVNGSQYDHEGINDAIGDPNDTVITPALKNFLALCFQ